MATNPSKVTEPAVPDGAAVTVTEPATDTPAVERVYDPNKSVHVYNTRNGKKLDRPVPETFLKQFPHLKEVPSKKAGK